MSQTIEESNRVDLTKLADIKILPIVEKIQLRGDNLVFHPKELVIKSTTNDIFNFLVLFNKSNNILFIYGGPYKNISQILKKQTLLRGVMDEETFEISYKVIGTDPKILKIDTSEKDYCIEMILKDEDVIKLNFITTNPKKGCKIDDKGCKNLDFLFKEIFSFLNSIGYRGKIFLEDDSMDDNYISLHLFRLFKREESIYCKYGFKYTTEAKKIIINPILKFLGDNNLFDPKLSKIDDVYIKKLEGLKEKFDFKIISKVHMINPDYRIYLNTCNFQKPKNCFLEQKEEIKTHHFGDSLPLSLDINDIEEENLENRVKLYIENLEKINRYDFEGLKIYRDLVLVNQEDLIDIIKNNQQILKFVLIYVKKILDNFDLKLKCNPLRIIKNENVENKDIKSKILEEKELLADLLLFLEKIEMFELILPICDEIIKY